MKKYKRVISQFTFHDRTGIQRYLENMALKGWMLDKITKWSWRFRRIEPKRIHFAVSYFAKTSSFEPEAPEELLRFREFCQYSGWTYCAEAAQMQIFYNEAENPIPIETDAMLEIESIHKSIKKQLLPSYFILLAVAVMNGWMRIAEAVENPNIFFRSNLNLFTFLSMVCILLMIAAELGSYFIWRTRALKRAELDGSFLPTRGNRGFVLALLYILVAVFVLLIVSEWNGTIGKVLLIVMGYYFALLLIVQGASDIMKRKKVGAGTNLTVTIILSFVLAFALIAVLSWTAARLDSSGFFEEKDEEYVLAPDEEYIFDGRAYTAQHHALPLYAADFYDHEVPEDVYSNYHYVDRSILITHHDCGSRVRYDYDDTWPAVDYQLISYFIDDFNSPLLRDFVLKSLLSRYEHQRYDGRYEFRTEDPELWNADAVWQMYGTEYIGGKKNPMDSFILVRGNRIVQLHLFEAPTQEQIAMIAEKLMS